ncbi:putative transferase At1g60990, chloroplastic isoform X2 [Manihot esculenta]|uniref:putative transferase At1g60990, chloroplastic isoform X2 n=1 Tax=Manihot esculenta TaxID=3983 RepID=UPI000B5D8943|nr:putative transferase At1g60990, chloroplastic isoform X2 [Manihot esculenta]
MAASSATCAVGSATTLLQPLLRERTIPLNSHHRCLNGTFWTGREKKKQQKVTFTSTSQSSKGCSWRPISASPFDLSPPPIDLDLLETLTADGAKASEDGIIETFDNDDEALDAFGNGVVVLDLSHFGRIRVSGDDRIQFLHNQSTANFECLHEGQGCNTVFVTPTARTIDIAYAWIMKNSIMLVVSPVTCGSIIQMLNKYIFFADKVEIEDINKKTSFFIIAGPKSNQLMVDLNLGDLVGQPYGTHHHYSVNGMPITVGVGNAISEEGYSFLMSPAAAGSVWRTLLSQGAAPMGSNAWEKLRIIQGCYKGQETISRLITYDGVKQRLWAIHLSAPAEPGSLITVDGRRVGRVTSYTSWIKGSGHCGLGYIKRNTVSEGSTVIIEDSIVGTVVDPPFLARQHPPSKSPSS